MGLFFSLCCLLRLGDWSREGWWNEAHYYLQLQGYPDEWFPSVSATIGDRYPERSIFQVFIAITSGPRFMLVFLWYLLTARPGAFAPKFVATVGLIRTLLCGGWVYITSTDDHGYHDVFMISYLVFTLPWTIGCLALSPSNRRAIKYRKTLAGLFFGTLVPLIYFYIQHKVHKVAGGKLVGRSMGNRWMPQGLMVCDSLYYLRILRVVLDLVRCGV